MNKIIILLFLNILPSVLTKPKVSITLENEVIVFGATTHLLCIFDDSMEINNDKNREWAGGVKKYGGGKKYGVLKYDVLCFNGKPTYPNKYREEVISTRKFRLKIFNTSESDINRYYICSYGVKYSSFCYGSEFISLFLDIKKIPYIYTPHHVKKEIKQENKDINVTIFLEKVHPVPICELQTEKTMLTMIPNVLSQANNFTYQVNMSINYTQSDNCTTEDTTEDTIRCFIKRNEILYWEKVFVIPKCNNNFKDVITNCNNNFKDENNKLSAGMGITGIVLFCVCSIIIIIGIFVFWRKQRIDRLNKEKNLALLEPMQI